MNKIVLLMLFLSGSIILETAIMQCQGNEKCLNAEKSLKAFGLQDIRSVQFRLVDRMAGSFFTISPEVTFVHVQEMIGDVFGPKYKNVALFGQPRLDPDSRVAIKNGHDFVAFLNNEIDALILVFKQ